MCWANTFAAFRLNDRVRTLAFFSQRNRLQTWSPLIHGWMLQTYYHSRCLRGDFKKKNPRNLGTCPKRGGGFDEIPNFSFFLSWDIRKGGGGVSCCVPIPNLKYKHFWVKIRHYRWYPFVKKVEGLNCSHPTCEQAIWEISLTQAYIPSCV